jgi:hypothetical protein
VGPVETAEQELVPGVVLEETEARPEVKQGEQPEVQPEEPEAETLKEELELDQKEPEALQEPQQPSQGW